MIFSSITFLDFSNLSGFFVPIFNHCNIIPYNLGVLISYSCDVFISFSQLINLHDLINLSIYLTSSIFLIFACFALFTKPLVFFTGRAGKILDTVAKIVVIEKGSSNLYKNHGGGSDSDYDKDKDKYKTNEDNKNNETKKQLILMQMVIKQLSNHVFLIINHFKLNRNIQRTQSFSLFAFILSQLNLNVDETATNLTQFSYGIFLLSLVALICFINVLGFMVTYIFIQKGNYEQKYPKLSKFINYYKKTTLIYVSIEAFLCLTCLILLVFFSFLFVYSGIKT